MSQENMDIVQAAFEAFQHGDTKGVLALCDPDIEITQPADLIGVPRKQHGHAGMLDAFAVWPEQWDDYRVEVVRMTDLGDQIMVSQIARGRGKNTGIPVEMLFTFLFGVRAGKIMEWRIFTREEDALNAVGLEE